MLTVLIASPLESENAARIGAFDPERARVIYEPDLLPEPRYEADHHGIRRELSKEQIERWRSHLAAADILFDFDWLDPAALPRTAPRLRWIQATSAGIGEFVARSGLAETPIVLTTAAGVHGLPLAEFVALALLYHTKGVPDLRAWQAGHRWQRYTTRKLAGQRMLLVGLGHVGREIARTVAGLGVDVTGMARSVPQILPQGVRRVITRDALRRSLADVDALVLACPYTKETHHLVGADELAAMRPSAIVVNVARGAVVDEPALVTALVRGRLAGAVLDVFETEPLPDDSPLWDMPNVLVSPHSASTVGGENSLIVDLFLDNLGRFLDGEPLRNVFDRDHGY